MDRITTLPVVELIEDDDDRSLFDRGLAYDLATLVDRRQVLKLIGATGLTAGIAACAPGATPGASARRLIERICRHLGRGIVGGPRPAP